MYSRLERLDRLSKTCATLIGELRPVFKRARHTVDLHGAAQSLLPPRLETVAVHITAVLMFSQRLLNPSAILFG
jgi:hypothetical protein